MEIHGIHGNYMTLPFVTMKRYLSRIVDCFFWQISDCNCFYRLIDLYFKFSRLTLISHGDLLLACHGQLRSFKNSVGWTDLVPTSIHALVSFFSVPKLINTIIIEAVRTAVIIIIVIHLRVLL